MFWFNNILFSSPLSYITYEMEGSQEADEDEQGWLQTFTSFVKNFVNDIIDCQSFQACDTEVKQRVKHLLFLLNFVEEGNCEQFQRVLQDNKVLLNDINDGSISWTSELYFKAWQQRVQSRYNKKVKINVQSSIKLEQKTIDDGPVHREDNEDIQSVQNERIFTQEDPSKCHSEQNYSSESLQKHEKNYEKNHEEEKEKNEESVQNEDTIVEETLMDKRKATLASVANDEDDVRTEGTELDIREDNEEEDGDGDAADDVRLSRSCVHEEFVQTYKAAEVTSETGKKRKVVNWSSACRHCPKVYPHKKQYMLKRHLQSQHIEKAKIAEYKDDLNRETQRANKDTAVEEPLFKGKTLVEILEENGIPLPHLWETQGLRSFKCQYCIAQFNSTKSLRKHEQNHEKIEKNLESNLYHNNLIYIEERELCKKNCGKKVIKSDMKRHLKQVHGPPTACPWCGFISKNLRRHLRRTQCDVPEDQRTKEETSQCHICSKMIEKKRIKSHIRVVHGDKSFECDQCEYKSYSRHNLVLHTKRVHEQKSLTEICPECNKKCVSLEWHIQTYHTSVS